MTQSSNIIRQMIAARLGKRIYDIVEEILNVCPDLYESDVKSVMLGMVRRDEIDWDYTTGIVTAKSS